MSDQLVRTNLNRAQKRVSSSLLQLVDFPADQEKGSKKVSFSYPGQVNFPAEQEMFHPIMDNGQVSRQIICQLSEKNTNELRHAYCKLRKIYELLVQRENWNSSFFESCLILRLTFLNEI